MFDKSHLSSPEVAPLVDGAKFYYVGGFFLTHGVESALEVAKKAATAGKVRLPERSIEEQELIESRRLRLTSPHLLSANSSVSNWAKFFLTSIYYLETRARLPHGLPPTVLQYVTFIDVIFGNLTDRDVRSW
jgi:hypothetical protein